MYEGSRVGLTDMITSDLVMVDHGDFVSSQVVERGQTMEIDGNTVVATQDGTLVKLTKDRVMLVKQSQDWLRQVIKFLKSESAKESK